MNTTNAVRVLEIDNQITDLHALIASLKTERNTLVPVFRLPDDILCRVFLEYALITGIFDLGWVGIMLVCRRWAVVARHHQALWSYISAAVHSHHDALRIKNQLSYSGLCPLKIVLEDRSDEEGSARIANLSHAQMKPHSTRIVSIEFPPTTGSNFAARMLQHIGTWPLPNLVDLHCRFLSPQELIQFPSTIFNQNAPRISSFSIGHCLFDWHSPRNLEHLTVEFRHDLQLMPLPRWPVLVAALKRSPRLETLDLQDCLPAVLDNLDGPLEPAKLGILQRLTLFGHVPRCCHMLSHLDFPPTTSLTLYTQGIFHAAQIRKLLVVCQKHLRSTDAPIIRQVALEGDETHIHLQFFTTTAPVEMFPAEEVSHISMNVHPQTEIDRRKILTKVFNMVPLASATHLNVQGMQILSIRTAKTMISLLPSLESITLSNNAAALGLCDALLEMLKVPSEPRKRFKATPAPLLHTISLRFFLYYSRSPDSDEALAAEIAANATSAKVMDAVASVTEAYKECGRPLERVVFANWIEPSGVLSTPMKHRLLDAVTMIYWEEDRRAETKDSWAARELQIEKEQKEWEAEVAEFEGQEA